jgi:hypothetical protein
MSLVFLGAFIMVVAGKMSAESFTTDVFIVWALFSIADALWVKTLCKK